MANLRRYRKSFKILVLLGSVGLMYVYFKIARGTFDIHRELDTINSIIFEPKEHFLEYFGHRERFGDDYSISIKFMTPFFGDWSHGNSFASQYNKEQRCPWKCHFANRTDNPSSSDVLLYHASDLKPEYIIKNRSTNQIWLLHSAESPWKIEARLSDYNLMFNWTCFVRFDSDLVMRYGQSKRSDPKSLEHNIPNLLPRNQSVYWMASNCGTMTDRDIYIEELKRYIDVDVYGKCLPNARKCISGDTRCNGENYNFYLAFENAVCRNYITEKFWRSLSIGVIPVVMGDSQSYKSVAPPNSYIDVADFDSPKQLAFYLKDVLSNLTLYRSYFAWKQHYKVSQTWQCFDCELCKTLHKWNGRRQVYKDLSGWHNQDYCPSWSGWNELKMYHAKALFFGRRLRRLIGV